MNNCNVNTTERYIKTIGERIRYSMHGARVVVDPALRKGMQSDSLFECISRHLILFTLPLFPGTWQLVTDLLVADYWEASRPRVHIICGNGFLLNVSCTIPGNRRYVVKRKR